MPNFELATFSADVNCPIGSRRMGVPPTPAKKTVDPLQAHGFVLFGGMDVGIQLLRPQQ